MPLTQSFKSMSTTHSAFRVQGVWWASPELSVAADNWSFRKRQSRHPYALIYLVNGVNAVWAVRRSVLGWQRVTSHWLPELSVARYCGWWQWSSHGRVDKHSEETERERTQALSGTGPQGGVMLYTFTGRSQGEKVHMPTLLGSVFHSLSQTNCCLLW